MKYLKKFDTHLEYEAAKSTLEPLNVVYCKDNNDVHINYVYEFEIWADLNCTTRATGEVSTLYVQFNRDVRINGDANYNNYGLYIGTPTDEWPDDPYFVMVYVDFGAPERLSNEYFYKGEVVEVTSYFGAPFEGDPIDITGWPTSFGEIIY